MSDSATEVNPVAGTLTQLVRFLTDAKRYQDKYPKERTKLTFAIIKQQQRYEKIRTEFSDEINLEINALRYKRASTDDKGNLIENKFDVKAGKGEDSSILRPTYKPEEMVKCDKEIETLKKSYENKPISIIPPYKLSPGYIDIPADFDFEFLESFKGFIFNPNLSEEDEEKIYFALGNNDQAPKPTVLPVVNI